MSDLENRLFALRKEAPRPKIARLRDVFDAINAALEDGVKRSDVHAALIQEAGFKDIPLSWFNLAIDKIRAERGITAPKRRNSVSKSLRKNAKNIPSEQSLELPQDAHQESIANSDSEAKVFARFTKPDIDFSELKREARNAKRGSK